MYSFSGDQVLDIKTKCLAVDWKNDDKLPHYVMVDNKEMVSQDIKLSVCLSKFFVS